jgi:lambda repressor-like predicted transcriptional regulator
MTKKTKTKGRTAGRTEVPVRQMRARIKVECARRGWALADLARACDRSPQWLNDVLHRENPKLETLRLLARALGCSLDKILRPVTAEEYGRTMMPRAN